MDHSSSGREAPKSAARLVITILLVGVLVLGAGGIAFVWLTIHAKHLVSGAARLRATVPALLDPGPKPMDGYATYVQTQAIMLTADTRLLQMVADDLAGRGLAFFAPARPPAAAEPGVQGPEGILRRAIAAGIIKATPVPNTELLQVTMVSEKGKEKEAKTIVDSLVRNYVAMWGVDKTQAASRDLVWLAAQRDEVLNKIQETRKQIRVLADQYGTVYLDRQTDLEMQQQKLWSEEFVRVQQRRMSLEAAAESSGAEGTVVDSGDLLSFRRNYVDSDPFVQALSRRIADIRVDLAAPSEKDLNDAALQRRQKALDTLEQQLDKLRQQFEAELSEALKKQSQQRLAQARRELQQTRAYEERLRQALNEQEPKAARVGRTSLDVQDQQFQLQLDQDLHDKICRRIQQMELEGKYPPAVEAAYWADVVGTVDHRWQQSLVVLGATILLSIILLIVRRVIRPRPPTGDRP